MAGSRPPGKVYGAEGNGKRSSHCQSGMRARNLAGGAGAESEYFLWRRTSIDGGLRYGIWRGGNYPRIPVKNQLLLFQ
jgi:hypothetical protein